MVSEGTYVVLVEFALFVVGGAGALLLHSEQACLRLDAAGVECLEEGPIYFAVLYGAGLAASAAALLMLGASVVLTALVPGRHSASVEGMALAALHWQAAVAVTLVGTVLVAWQQHGNERHALFAVLLRTSIGRAEHEYLTKLYAVCVFVYLGFLVAFALVLYVGVARAGNSSEPHRLYSLSVSMLLLAVFVQRWLSAYRRRVCDNVAVDACMPALARFRASWFEPEYDTAYETGLLLAALAVCDVVGAKARSVFMKHRRLKPLLMLVFLASRFAVLFALGIVVLQLEYDYPALWYWNAGLWGAGALCSLLDTVAFGFVESDAPAAAVVLGRAREAPQPALDVAVGRRIVLRRKKLDLFDGRPQLDDHKKTA